MKVDTSLLVALFGVCLQADMAAASKRPKTMVRGGEKRGGDEESSHEHSRSDESAPTSDEEGASRALAFTNSTAIGSSSGQQGIVGGTVSTARPWFAEGFGCGATLIWRDFLVTAAHCYDSRYAYDSFSPGDAVIIGHTRTETLTSGAEAKTIMRVFRHPSYNPKTNANDIMLVQLTSTVQETRPLAQLNINRLVPAVGAAVKAFGYGALSEDGPSPDTLRVVTLKAVADAKCKQAYKGLYQLFPNLMTCAWAKGKDTCSGDSGGPLMLGNTNILVGITSWGQGCANPGFPGVYTRVSSYKAWIQGILCGHSSQRPSFC